MRDVKQLARSIWEVAKEPPSIAALFYSFLAFAASQGMDYYKTHREHHEKQISRHVDPFIDSSREFDALVPALAHGIMEQNKPDPTDRARLIANLSRQYSELAELAPLLKDSPEILDAYRKSLTQLNQELPRTNSIPEMKGFWESVGHVIEARRALNEKLRRSANLSLD